MYQKTLKKILFWPSLCQTKIEEMSKSEDGNFEHYSKSLVPLSGGYERQIYVPLKPLAGVKEHSWRLLFKYPSRVDSTYYVGLLFINQNKETLSSIKGYCIIDLTF
jgi:hypothetical protein